METLTLPQRIAANLKMLRSKHDFENKVIAQRSGVGDRTLSYMLSGTGNPTVENVDAVARVFGLTGWHLMSPTLAQDLENQDWLDRIHEAYNLSNPQGREMLQKATEITESLNRKAG